MDRLEEFIRQNRDQLDRYAPPAGAWEKIGGTKSKNRLIRVILITAAASVLIFAGFTSALWILHRGSETGVKGTPAQLQHELRESERFYNSLYYSIYAEARPLLTGRPDVDREIKESSLKIDSICSDLKKDLKDNASNREVIEALIRNYRIKIQLLEDMLDAVKQNEPVKKIETHEL
jgi:hypothetical protein